MNQGRRPTAQGLALRENAVRQEALLKRLVVIGSIVALAGAAILVWARRNNAEAASYRFVTVTRGNIASTVNSTGTLGAVQTVAVGTQVSGQIAALYADFNGHVRKGQVIAKLDPTLLEEAVNEATAEVARADADLRQKQYVLTQTDTLYKAKIVTETELKTAQYNAQMSQASLESAQSNLSRAKRNLSYATIYAPISGVVIERNVQVGQTVAASLQAPQLFLIAEDLSRMQILASVDESDIGQIREGQAVHFTVQAYPSRTFQGVVQQVRMQSTTTENVVNYTVVVSVANADGALLPGMTATVSFQLAQAANVFKVPNAALRLRATEAMIAAAQQGAGSPAAESAASGRLAGAAGGTRAADSARGRDTARLRRGAAATRVESGGETVSGNVVPMGAGTLWYLDASGKPAVMHVRTGLSDGQETQITGAGVREGLRVIAAVTSSAATPGQTGVSSPFQTAQQGRGGPGGRGGFPP
jgi:HlyD family secretion protein